MESVHSFKCNFSRFLVNIDKALDCFGGSIHASLHSMVRPAELGLRVILSLRDLVMGLVSLEHIKDSSVLLSLL